MKILIIEDDEKLAQMLKIAFKINNVQADYCTNGEQADKEIQNRPKDYSLIIVDLMLPGKDGFEIIGNLKKRNIASPVLVLTAKNSREDINRAIKLGVKEYFVKPFSFADLLTRVKHILQLAPA